MDNVTENKAMKHDDEISLVDLLAVVLRWRWVLAVMIIVAMLIGFVFWRQDRQNAATRELKVQIQAFFLDPLLEPKMQKPIVESIGANPNLLTNLSGNDFNDLQETSVRVEYNETQMQLLVTVSSLDKRLSPKHAELALEAVLETYANLTVRPIFYEIRRTAQLSDGPRAPIGNATGQERLPIEAYATMPASYLIEGDAWLKKSLIALFACLFLGVLLEFFLEFFDRLKADQQSWAKLKAAVKRQRYS